MSKQSISGKTEQELDELRDEFENSPASDEKTFSEAFCLAKIPRQPEDYNGPDRYCALRRVKENGRCKFHGGCGHGNPDNLDPLANMSHGMYATQDHLIEDFDESDWALYHWVLTKYPEAYNIDLDKDPSSHHDLHLLAVEMIRAERGGYYVIKEGERSEEPIRSNEGELVLDAEGEVVTEASEHYLASMINRQNNLILMMQDHLGISRRERLEREAN